MSRRFRPAALPLRWRLVLAAVAVLAAVLSVFGSVLYRDLSGALLDAIGGGLQTSAHTVVGQEVHESLMRLPGAPGPAPVPPSAPGGAQLLPAEALQDATLLPRIALDLTNPDQAARVVGPDGQALAEAPSGLRFPTPPDPTLDPALYRSVAAAQQPRRLSVPAPGGPLLVELIPLTEAGRTGAQTLGLLQISTPLHLATDLLGRLRLLLVAGTLVAIGATAALTALLVRALLGPLRRMTATSRAIAAGDLRRRVVVPAGGDELAELAGAFNHMVERLEALLLAQRRFLADASHELRTPLTALSGGLEMLLLPEADPAARARLLRLLQGETERMRRLVDGLLTLTRLDAGGKEALAIAPLDLAALAAQVVDETRLLAPELAVELEADAPLVVPGDADRLHQVLLNLCANARAHTRPSGRITVSVRREGGAARLAVADSGGGIAPEELPYVWDRLYRGDPSRRRQAGQGGLGLGLAIVRAIVEGHGGTVAIASRAGLGTTVTVTLPGAAGAAAPPPAAVSARGGGPV